MLKATIHNRGNMSVIHCQGRIVVGAGISILRAAVLFQTDSHTLVLDLAEVECIDAGGLGTLLELRAWARSRGIHLKLLNLRDRVQRVFELTRLDGVFEIGSFQKTFPLAHRLLQVAWSDRSP